MDKTELTREQIMAVADAAASNASDLLAEARLLLDAGRHARAHALAVLALEEFGKHGLSVVGLLQSGDKEFWARYWSAFRSHNLKLRQARILVQLVEELGDIDEIEHLDRSAFRRRIDEWCDSEHFRRMHGLYVEVAADGSISKPMDAITPEEARAVLDDVELVVQFAKRYQEAMRGVEAEGWDGFDRLVARGEPPYTVAEARRKLKELRESHASGPDNADAAEPSSEHE